MLHVELVSQIILDGIIGFILGIMIFLIATNRTLKGAPGPVPIGL
jgi:hypothetical protein